MRRKILSLDSQIINEVSASIYLNQGEDPRHKRMKKLLSAAIKNELTERQRECLLMFYYDNLPVDEISGIIGIKPTTVYKHLKKARLALKKCTPYL